jgi:hypothetical protein
LNEASEAAARIFLKAPTVTQRQSKLLWLFVAFLACLPAHAQDIQFLPEVDTYLRLDPNVQVYLQAKNDRDGGDPQQFTFGPSIEFYVKPLVRLKRVSLFDLNQTKSRTLVLESGYRIITAPATPNENRLVEAATIHLPLFAGILVADRNRFDLDWKSGMFSWRYRNRLTLQRTFSIHSFHFIPYIAAEPFYESQYKKWSSTDLYAGSLFPVGKHVEFNTYFEFENDTDKKPNRQQYFVGLALYLFFSREGNSH